MLKPDVRAYEIMISETLRTKHYKNILKVCYLFYIEIKIYDINQSIISNFQLLFININIYQIF